MTQKLDTVNLHVVADELIVLFHTMFYNYMYHLFSMCNTAHLSVNKVCLIHVPLTLDPHQQGQSGCVFSRAPSSPEGRMGCLLRKNSPASYLGLAETCSSTQC